jgi:hypothetical protein
MRILGPPCEFYLRGARVAAAAAGGAVVLPRPARPALVSRAAQETAMRGGQTPAERSAPHRLAPPPPRCASGRSTCRTRRSTPARALSTTGSPSRRSRRSTSRYWSSCGRSSASSTASASSSGPGCLHGGGCSPGVPPGAPGGGAILLHASFSLRDSP